MDKPRLHIRRSERDTAADIGYVREDGTYASRGDLRVELIR